MILSFELRAPSFPARTCINLYNKKPIVKNTKKVPIAVVTLIANKPIPIINKSAMSETKTNAGARICKVTYSTPRVTAKSVF